MSASSSSKFQDHYALFGIDPKASSETIQAAYTKLAQKYHPNTPETGDKEKFDAINLAYEVLTDPDLRKGFDKIKGVDAQGGEPKFSGLQFFEALGRGTGLRSALLCLMYDRRRSRPFTPSLSMRHLENMLVATAEELNFALWYLKQRNLLINDDKSSLQITVDGMDRLEKDRPSPELVMPFFKPAALEAAAAAQETPAAELATLASAVTTGGDESAAPPGFGARMGSLLRASVARSEAT
jgi:curved DNA-binding protein CbpA